MPLATEVIQTLDLLFELTNSQITPMLVTSLHSCPSDFDFRQS